MSETIIDLREMRFRWPGASADLLAIPALTVEKGAHLFIQGPSGSGKTTLLNLLTGINRATAGSITMLGTAMEQLTNAQRDQFRADHLGVIFQQFNLLPYLSLIENVQLPCGFSSRKRAQAGDPRAAATRLLRGLNMPAELHNTSVDKLSVGQQQRAAVARALIGKPEIVIADEPTSALDSDNRDRFLDLLFQETAEQGSTLIFVSHDRQIAERFTHVVDLNTINKARHASQ